MPINWDVEPSFHELRTILVRTPGPDVPAYFEKAHLTDRYTDIAVIEDLLREIAVPAEDGEYTTPGFYLSSSKAGTLRAAFLAREDDIADTKTMRLADLLQKAQTEGLDMFFGEAM